MKNKNPMPQTEKEWEKILTPEQYKIMREKRTEAPFTGRYVHEKTEGMYKCSACGNPLFPSDAKFDSGTGWPSFDKSLPGSIKYIPDSSHGMERTEVVCAKCGSHLGHLFQDGPTKTGKRYCINSVCLELEKENKKFIAQKILIPPKYEDVSGPLIFLAGPIQGALDWQKEAIEIIKNLTPNIHIASPRRPIKSDGEFTEKDYHEQVEWEHHYLDYAAKHGVILFWLAKEAKNIPGRAYAQTTRFELGEAVARHYINKIKVVVGIEKGFSNERYLRKTIIAKGPDIPLLDNLENTCETAVKLLS